MKKNIILMLKGMLIGVANIIPGVSGGTLMITLGLYEEIIDVISHFFKNFKKNILFILPIGIGMVLSVLILSKIISFSLEKYAFPTTFFFIGLILGGIPLLWKRASAAKKNLSNWAVFAITFGIILVFTFLKSGSYVVSVENPDGSMMIKILFIGMISAATMVIPGISGSFVLMLLGFYEPIVNTIRDLTKFDLLGHNILVLAPFGIGILVGIVLVAKLIEYLLHKYPVKTYYGVLGFVIASIIAIVKPVLSNSTNVLEIIISIVLLGIGSVLAYKLGDK